MPADEARQMAGRRRLIAVMGFLAGVVVPQAAYSQYSGGAGEKPVKADTAVANFSAP